MKTRRAILSCIFLGALGCSAPDSPYDGQNAAGSTFIEDESNRAEEGRAGRVPNDKRPSTDTDSDEAIVVEAAGCEPIDLVFCEEIYGQDEISPLGGLRAAGDLWLAEALWESGFVLFDGRGEFRSKSLIQLGNLDRAAPSADDIHVVTVDGEGVRAGSFDMKGQPMGEGFQISADLAHELAIGRSDTGSLVVWATPTRVAARAFSAAGPEGESFDLETNLWKDDFHASIADTRDGEFAIAWSDRRVSDSHYRVFFIRADGQGSTGLHRVLMDSLERYRVVALRRSLEGYRLLLEGEGHALLLPLTILGDPDGPPRRYTGLSRVDGLAIHQDGTMLLAGMREGGQGAVLWLDGEGAPLDGWRCIDAFPREGEHAVSVEDTSEGFAILHRSAVSQQLLWRVSVR